MNITGIYIYDGAQWKEPEYIKRYNGTKWQECTVNRYDGSQWETIFPSIRGELCVTDYAVQRCRVYYKNGQPDDSFNYNSYIASGTSEGDSSVTRRHSLIDFGMGTIREDTADCRILKMELVSQMSFSDSAISSDSDGLRRMMLGHTSASNVYSTWVADYTAALSEHAAVPMSGEFSVPILPEAVNALISGSTNMLCMVCAEPYTDKEGFCCMRSKYTYLRVTYVKPTE